MNISVVVSTYDRTDDLVDCLRSLRAQFDPPAEVIVVDDGTYERTRERLDARGLLESDRVRHIKGPGKGLPAARNAGIDAAEGDIVAFVDDDTVAPPNWTRELKRTYEEFPEAAGVGGYVLNYNPEDINKANVESTGYRALQAFRDVFLRERIGEVSPVGVLWAPHVFMTSRPRRVETLQGCNMSFRREVVERYRFDEWYGTSGSSALEEVDFGVRVTLDGETLIYAPRAVVVHRRTIETGAEGRSGGPNYGNIANLGYFVLKHPEMTVGNLALLAILVCGYSVVKRDGGYLRGLLNGVASYYRSSGTRRAHASEGDEQQ